MPYQPFTTAAEEAAVVVRARAIDFMKAISPEMEASAPKTANNFELIAYELHDAADWLQQRHERELEAAEEQALQIANEPKEIS